VWDGPKETFSPSVGFQTLVWYPIWVTVLFSLHGLLFRGNSFSPPPPPFGFPTQTIFWVFSACGSSHQNGASGVLRSGSSLSDFPTPVCHYGTLVVRCFLPISVPPWVLANGFFSGLHFRAPRVASCFFLAKVRFFRVFPNFCIVFCLLYGKPGGPVCSGGSFSWYFPFFWGT